MRACAEKAVCFPQYCFYDYTGCWYCRLCFLFFFTWQLWEAALGPWLVIGQCNRAEVGGQPVRRLWRGTPAEIDCLGGI